MPNKLILPKGIPVRIAGCFEAQLSNWEHNAHSVRYNKSGDIQPQSSNIGEWFELQDKDILMKKGIIYLLYSETSDFENISIALQDLDAPNNCGYVVDFPNVDGEYPDLPINFSTCPPPDTCGKLPPTSPELRIDVDKNNSKQINLTADAVDPDGDDVSIYGIFRYPENGTVTIDDNMNVTYTPYNDYVGPDFFLFRLKDTDDMVSDPIVCNITVHETNISPVAVSDTIEIWRDTPTVLNVLDNDYDVDGDEISINEVLLSLNGVSVLGNNEILFTPDDGFVGDAQISYNVTDGFSVSSNAIVDIVVKDFNFKMILTYLTPYFENGIDSKIGLTFPANASLYADYNKNVGFQELTSGAKQFISPSVGYAEPTIDVTVIGTVRDSLKLIEYVENAPNVQDYLVGIRIVEEKLLNIENFARHALDVETIVFDSHDVFDEATNFIGSFSEMAKIKYIPFIDSVSGTQFNNMYLDNPELLCIGGINTTNIVDSTATEGMFDGDDNLLYPRPSKIALIISNDGYEYENLVQCNLVDNFPPITDSIYAETKMNVAIDVDVVGLAFDPDGDAVSIDAIQVQPQHGTAVIDGDNIRYTPDVGYLGEDSLLYTLIDSNGNVSFAYESLVINVVVNIQAPVANDDNVVGFRNTTTTIDVLVNDTDAQGTAFSIYTIQSVQDGSQVTSLNGKIEFTPADGFIGTTTFQYTVKDTDGNQSNLATVTVDVLDINLKMELSIDDSTSGNRYASTYIGTQLYAKVGEDNTYIPITSDERVSLTQGVYDVTVVGVGITEMAALSYDVGFTSYRGVYRSIRVIEEDLTSIDRFIYNSGIDTVLFDSENVFDRVEVFDKAFSDTDAKYIPLIDSVLGQSFIDMYRDSVELLCIGGINTTNAQSIDDKADMFTNTPALVYPIPDEVTDLTDVDGAIFVNTHECLNNTPPVAADIETETEQGQAIIIDVVSQATDVDGDEISITIDDVIQPNNGTVTIENGKLVYTPNDGFVGTDTISYRVADAFGESEYATITMTVNSEPNIAPIANDDTLDAYMNKTTELQVLSNDTDANGDALLIHAVTNIVNGTATIANNKIQFTPDVDYVGPASFDYDISDGELISNTAHVTITVQDYDFKIVLTLDDENLDDGPRVFGFRFNGTMKANYNGGDTYYDITDGETFAITDSEGNGDPTTTLTLMGNGVTYFRLSDYQSNISDYLLGATFIHEELTSASAMFLDAYKLNNVVFDETPFSKVHSMYAAFSGCNAIQYIPFINNVADSSYSNYTEVFKDCIELICIGGITTYQPNGGTSSKQNMFTNTPSLVDPTLAEVNELMSNDGFAYINQNDCGGNGNGVLGDDTPPVAGALSVVTPEDIPVYLDVILVASDESNPITISIIEQPSNGIAIIENGLIKYTPNLNWFGDDTVRYRLIDPNGNESAFATAYIDVIENLAPIGDDFSVNAQKGDDNLEIYLDNKVSDPEGDSITINSVTMADSNEFTASYNGLTITVVAPVDYIGETSLTYTLIDSHNNISLTQIIYITYSDDANVKPVINPNITFTIRDKQSPFIIDIADVTTDGNGDDVEFYEVLSSSGYGTFTITNPTTLEFTPYHVNRHSSIPVQDLQDTIRFTVTDGVLVSLADSIDITTQRNNAPEIDQSILQYTTYTNTPITFKPDDDINGNMSDAENDYPYYFYSILNAPLYSYAGATLVLDNPPLSPTATYNPAPSGIPADYAYNDVFKMEVGDWGDSNTGLQLAMGVIVTLSPRPINDPNLDFGDLQANGTSDDLDVIANATDPEDLLPLQTITSLIDTPFGFTVDVIDNIKIRLTDTNGYNRREFISHSIYNNTNRGSLPTNIAVNVIGGLETIYDPDTVALVETRDYEILGIAQSTEADRKLTYLLSSDSGAAPHKLVVTSPSSETNTIIGDGVTYWNAPNDANASGLATITVNDEYLVFDDETDKILSVLATAHNQRDAESDYSTYGRFVVGYSDGSRFGYCETMVVKIFNVQPLDVNSNPVPVREFDLQGITPNPNGYTTYNYLIGLNVNIEDGIIIALTAEGNLVEYDYDDATGSVSFRTMYSSKVPMVNAQNAKLGIADATDRDLYISDGLGKIYRIRRTAW